MKVYSLAILILSFNFVVFGQKQELAKPFLIVDAEGGKSIKLVAADFAKLPHREVKAKGHDENEATYSGIELRQILLLAGVKLDKELRGPQLAAYVVIEAADGYKVVFGIAEIDSGFTDKVVILADTKESKPLAEGVGPWQIIVPDEKRPGRWVRQVTAIHVRLAK